MDVRSCCSYHKFNSSWSSFWSFLFLYDRSKQFTERYTSHGLLMYYYSIFCARQWNLSWRNCMTQSHPFMRRCFIFVRGTNTIFPVILWYFFVSTLNFTSCVFWKGISYCRSFYLIILFLTEDDMKIFCANCSTCI